MTNAYKLDAPKKATNLSVNSDLLSQAKELKINLSQSFEMYLAELVAKKYSESWRKENRKAIEKYNEDVSNRGAFSRSFLLKRNVTKFSQQLIL